MSQFFTSGGQSIGVSASAPVLPMNIQGRFPLGWTGWISLQSTGLSRVFSNTTVQKHQFFGAQPSLWSNSHIHTIPCTVTQNIPGFQDKVFKEMIKLKCSHSCGCQSSLTGVLIKRVNLGAQRQLGCICTEERPCEDSVRRWPSASQGERPQTETNLPTP